MRKLSMSVALAAVALLVVAPVFAADDSMMASTLEKWQTTFNAGDEAAVAALYAEDGCRLPPNAARIDGREAIAAAIALQHEQGIASVKLGLDNAMTSGDWGHSMGTWAVSDADGKELDHGKWMNVSHKTADGWRIQCDIWNSDLPLPAAGDMAHH
jgi:ketosteroid isomerase-like protein